MANMNPRITGSWKFTRLTRVMHSGVPKGFAVVALLVEDGRSKKWRGSSLTGTGHSARRYGETED